MRENVKQRKITCDSAILGRSEHCQKTRNWRRQVALEGETGKVDYFKGNLEESITVAKRLEKAEGREGDGREKIDET